MLPKHIGTNHIFTSLKTCMLRNVQLKFWKINWPYQGNMIPMVINVRNIHIEITFSCVVTLTCTHN